MRNLSLRTPLFMMLFLAISFSDSAYAQCPCWEDGIDAALLPEPSDNFCERMQGSFSVISDGGIVNDCPLTVTLGVNSDGCIVGTTGGNRPPCTAAAGDAPDPDGICLQELTQFCEELQMRPIPTLSEWGLLAMAGVLGLIGLVVLRRRKAAA